MIDKNAVILLIVLSLLLGASFIIYEQVQNEINELEVAEFNKRSLKFYLTKVKIENYLENLRDKITIVANKQSEIFNQLIAEPKNNVELLTQIQAEISKDLPDSFISTLADAYGNPIIPDFDGFVSEVCTENLKDFSRNKEFEIRIHPNPHQYHFDVMVPYQAPGQNFSGTFFTSFKTTHLSELLRQGEDESNRLYILFESIPSLIEVSSKGDRVNLNRKNKLTDEEMQRVSIRERINNTSWSLVNLPSQEDPLLQAKNRVIRKGFIEITLLFLLVGLLFYNIYKAIKLKIDLAKRKELYLDEKINDIINNSTDAILSIDEQQKIIFFNAEAERLFGYTSPEIIGQELSILLPEQVQRHHRSFVRQFRDSSDNKVNYKGRERNVTISGLHKDGHLFPLDIGISKTKSMDGDYIFTAFIRDLTWQNALIEEKEQAIAALEHLANHDPLTKLPNRRQLRSDFQTESKRAQRFNRKMALYYMDLDKFKGINDDLGHEIGDKLLRKISETISRSLRENEKVYRVGGDEFCVLISEFQDKQQLGILAERIINEISNIYNFNGMEIDIGCSIGIAIFPDNGTTLQDLTSVADRAMYTIKTANRNSFCFVQ